MALEVVASVAGLITFSASLLKTLKKVQAFRNCPTEVKGIYMEVKQILTDIEMLKRLVESSDTSSIIESEFLDSLTDISSNFLALEYELNDTLSVYENPRRRDKAKNIVQCYLRKDRFSGRMETLRTCVSLKLQVLQCAASLHGTNSNREVERDQQQALRQRLLRACEATTRVRAAIQQLSSDVPSPSELLNDSTTCVSSNIEREECITPGTGICIGSKEVTELVGVTLSAPFAHDSETSVVKYNRKQPLIPVPRPVIEKDERRHAVFKKDDIDESILRRYGVHYDEERGNSADRRIVLRDRVEDWKLDVIAGQSRIMRSIPSQGWDVADSPFVNLPECDVVARLLKSWTKLDPEKIDKECGTLDKVRREVYAPGGVFIECESVQSSNYGSSSAEDFASPESSGDLKPHAPTPPPLQKGVSPSSPPPLRRATLHDGESHISSTKPTTKSTTQQKVPSLSASTRQPPAREPDLVFDNTESLETGTNSSGTPCRSPYLEESRPFRSQAGQPNSDAQTQHTEPYSIRMPPPYRQFNIGNDRAQKKATQEDVPIQQRPYRRQEWDKQGPPPWGLDEITSAGGGRYAKLFRRAGIGSENAPRRQNMSSRFYPKSSYQEPNANRRAQFGYPGNLGPEYCDSAPFRNQQGHRPRARRNKYSVRPHSHSNQERGYDPVANFSYGRGPSWDSSDDWDSDGWDSDGWDSDGWDSDGWDSDGWDSDAMNGAYQYAPPQRSSMDYLQHPEYPSGPRQHSRDARYEPQQPPTLPIPVHPPWHMYRSYLVPPPLTLPDESWHSEKIPKTFNNPRNRQKSKMQAYASLDMDDETGGYDSPPEFNIHTPAKPDTRQKGVCKERAAGNPPDRHHSKRVRAMNPTAQSCAAPKSPVQELDKSKTGEQKRSTSSPSIPLHRPSPSCPTTAFFLSKHEREMGVSKEGNQNGRGHGDSDSDIEGLATVKPSLHNLHRSLETKKEANETISRGQRSQNTMSRARKSSVGNLSDVSSQTSSVVKPAEVSESGTISPRPKASAPQPPSRNIGIEDLRPIQRSHISAAPPTVRQPASSMEHQMARAQQWMDNNERRPPKHARENPGRSSTLPEKISPMTTSVSMGQKRDFDGHKHHTGKDTFLFSRFHEGISLLNSLQSALRPAGHFPVFTRGNSNGQTFHHGPNPILVREFDPGYVPQIPELSSLGEAPLDNETAQEEAKCARTYLFVSREWVDLEILDRHGQKYLEAKDGFFLNPALSWNDIDILTQATSREREVALYKHMTSSEEPTSLNAPPAEFFFTIRQRREQENRGELTEQSKITPPSQQQQQQQRPIHGEIHVATQTISEARDGQGALANPKASVHPAEQNVGSSSIARPLNKRAAAPSSRQARRESSVSSSGTSIVTYTDDETLVDSAVSCTEGDDGGDSSGGESKRNGHFLLHSPRHTSSSSEKASLSAKSYGSAGRIVKLEDQKTRAKSCGIPVVILDENAAAIQVDDGKGDNEQMTVGKKAMRGLNWVFDSLVMGAHG
ncbi:hypothetical protein MKZ38_006217 [Zalerion maritima]|uniref:Fungal N-terminal domain-containing protein n=1 Tax=Zalerion maritima TaxID=339359 RepID=A0AAD5RWP3_9PEZI|nr:hypothetical protein MKZ38_006217 [Zalerion maritima]